MVATGHLPGHPRRLGRSRRTPLVLGRKHFAGNQLVLHDSTRYKKSSRARYASESNCQADQTVMRRKKVSRNISPNVSRAAGQAKGAGQQTPPTVADAVLAFLRTMQNPLSSVGDLDTWADWIEEDLADRDVLNGLSSEQQETLARL